jgi:L-lactate dehydrogenase
MPDNDDQASRAWKPELPAPAMLPLLAVNNPNAMFVVVTNPVDVITYAAWKLSGFAVNRVMGVGTLVDSARFRALLSQEEHIHPDDLRAYILGEHGSNQPILSSAEAGGGSEQQPCKWRRLLSKVLLFH